MPSEFLHSIVGLKVAKTLGMLGKQTMKLIVLGSQGPDIFLYMPFEKDIYIFGKALHDPRNAPLFIRQLGENLRKEYPAFAIAYASHYILDEFLHPYINARTKDSITHGQLERAIDRAYMEYIGKPFIGFKISTALPDKIPYHIDIAMRDSMKSIPIEKPYLVGYYSAAYRYMLLYQKTYDYAPILIEGLAYSLSKLGISYLCQGIRHIPFKDPLNINRKAWIYNGEIHHEDVIYLVNRAIEETVERGRAYLEGSPLTVD